MRTANNFEVLGGPYRVKAFIRGNALTFATGNGHQCTLIAPDRDALQRAWKDICDRNITFEPDFLKTQDVGIIDASAALKIVPTP